MLVFFDESFQRDKNGKLHYAFAGFGIDESSYRALTTGVYKAKQQYFIKDEGFTNEERIEASKRHIVVKEDLPEEHELKAHRLLTRRQAEHFMQHGGAPGVQMTLEILELMQRLKVTVFASLVVSSESQQDWSTKDRLPVYLTRLLERIQMWMQEEHSEKMAVLAMDSVKNEIDLGLSRQVANYLYKSSHGKAMRHIVVSPFWVTSDSHAGTQCADLIAHILMNSMLATSERKPLDALWRLVVSMEFRSVDQKTRGIKKINQQTGATLAGPG